MPIDPEDKFKKAIAGLKPESTPQWAKKMADAVDGLVTNKAQLTGITGSITFTFNKAIFMTQLMALTFTPLAPVAAQAIGLAWGTAMLASTIIVAPGASLGAPTPATTWSVVIASLIDPPTITVAQTGLIATLAVMQAVKKAEDSALGPALYKAFTQCTATVTGLNSLPPPAGPLPLLSPLTPFM
jgi:hypothetical protein